MSRAIGSVRRFVARHPDALALLIIGVVAGLLRLAFLYRAPVLLTGDSQSHFLPGFDLVRGYAFDPELRRPPGYAAFVAGVITLLGEDLRALAFAQHLLGIGAALLTYGLGRLTFGRAAGLAGGLLVALNGSLILSGQSVMTETLFTALLLGTLVLLLVAGRSGRLAWCLAAGLLLGAAVLTRPVAQLLVPLVPLAFLLYSRRPGHVVRGTMLVGVGALLLVGPWTLRNLSEHGTLSAAGGLGRSLVARTVKYDEAFFDTDRPAADDDLKGQVRQFIRGKRNTIRKSRSVRSTQTGLMKEFGLTQAQSDRLMRDAAIEAIMERPGYYVVGSLRMAGQIAVGKVEEDTLSERWLLRRDKDWVEQWEARIDHLIQPSSMAEQREQGRAQALANIFQPATFGATLPVLALAGLVAAIWYRPALLPGLAGLGILLASAALDGPVPRYRYPLDPLIALFAAGAVTTLAVVAWRVVRRPSRSAGVVLPGDAPAMGRVPGPATAAEASR
ncbi:MAG: glycosyltransferase family 39 protein [Chloroflexota bacterium]|nr:glycosyltransferase family 39 protein [Chloroflexota bacterium]